MKFFQELALQNFLYLALKAMFQQTLPLLKNKQLKLKSNSYIEKFSNKSYYSLYFECNDAKSNKSHAKIIKSFSNSS